LKFLLARKGGRGASHPPERAIGADCHSAHSGTTQQGAQQPADTENLRAKRDQRTAKGREPKDQSRKPHQYFLRGSMSALSFPKLPGDVKD